MRRSVVRIGLLVLVLAAVAGAGAAAKFAAPNVPGKYRVIGKFRPKVDGAVEAIEVFSLDCPHSRALALDLPDLLARYESRVRHVEVPVSAEGASPLPVKLLLIARRYNKGPEVKRALFEARHVKGEDLGDPQVLARIAAENGIGERFTTLVFSREINDEYDAAQKVVTTYGITATPSVVVNRALLITPAIAGGGVEGMRADLAEILQAVVGW
jgi:protein-disulfide isomerase